MYYLDNYPAGVTDEVIAKYFGDDEEPQKDDDHDTYDYDDFEVDY